MFVYNFDSGVNFCGENFENSFAGTFFADGGKNRKNRKNLVPHGISGLWSKYAQTKFSRLSLSLFSSILLKY